MGFFSWNCLHCGESVKAPYGLPREIAWQNRVVAIRDGEGSPDKVRGNYDGYGRVLDPSEPEAVRLSPDLDHPPKVWHERCYSQRPYVVGPSPPADDQGYFYERNDDDWPLEGVAAVASFTYLKEDEQ
jgi:hypothetical protein